jgi:hypothetical protein
LTTEAIAAPPLAAPEIPVQAPGVIDGVIVLTRELRELLHDQLELAVLETRLCLDGVIRMVVIAVVTAVLLVSTWLALIGAGLLALIGIGLTPAIALALLAAANLLLALCGWFLIRHTGSNLGWPATLRLLKPGTSAVTAGGNG